MSGKCKPAPGSRAEIIRSVAGDLCRSLCAGLHAYRMNG